MVDVQPAILDCWILGVYAPFCLRVGFQKTYTVPTEIISKFEGSSFCLRTEFRSSTTSVLVVFLFRQRPQNSGDSLFHMVIIGRQLVGCVHYQRPIADHKIWTIWEGNYGSIERQKKVRKFNSRCFSSDFFQGVNFCKFPGFPSNTKHQILILPKKSQ